MLPRLYVDHLVFRVRNIGATAAFYQKLLGDPAFQSDDSVMYLAGETRLFFTPSASPIAEYDKEQPGLNHLAFGTRTPAQLQKVLAHLNASAIQHSGIQIDSYGEKEFIWLDDPDGFRLEFYCRPEP